MRDKDRYEGRETADDCATSRWVKESTSKVGNVEERKPSG